MTFPLYNKYKKTGVEWLGDVPEHWTIKRLRFAALLNPSKREVGNLDRLTEVSFLPMEAIGDDGSLRLDERRTIEQLEGGYTYFRDGDVTLAKITPCYENGKGALMKGLVNGIGFGTTELIVARPRPEQVEGAFLHYLFISPAFRRIGESFMYGAGGQKRVPDAFVRDYTTALPPLSEQNDIVSFLNAETAKIDELAGEQQHLMVLLAEKRQAVIAHAVTKGLSLSAPTKPSGIEWLGNIPAHWRMLRLKHISPRISGRLVYQPAQYFELEGVPFLMGNNITENGIQWEDVKLIPSAINESFSQHALREGDVITVRVGAPGVTCVVPKEASGLNCGSLMIIRRSQSFNSHWLSSVMNSFVVREQIARVQYGAAQEQINITDAVNFLIPTPPLAEQAPLAAYIFERTTQFDALAAEAKRAIGLLQERRTALISAAVTGQIDVRAAAERKSA